MSRWDRTEKAGAPEWFWTAVETPSDEHRVTVDDCDVVYRTWTVRRTAPACFSSTA
jgi:hypothetical protein